MTNMQTIGIPMIERTHLTTGKATIAASGTESTSIKTQGYALGRIYTPAVLTGTTLAVEVSHDGQSFVPARDADSVALSLTVAVDQSYRIPDAAFPANFMRFVSGASEAVEAVFGIELEA